MSKVYTPTPRVLSHVHSFLTNSPNKKTLELKARNSIQNSRRQCLGTLVPKPAAAIKSCMTWSWIGFCQKSTKRAKGNTTISTVTIAYEYHRYHRYHHFGLVFFSSLCVFDCGNKIVMICYDKLSIISHQLGDRFSLIGTPCPGP